MVIRMQRTLWRHHLHTGTAAVRAYPRQTPSPATGEVLASHDLLPNVMLRGVLQLLRTCRRPAADQ